jgi:ankyrin repeat protein
MKVKIAKLREFEAKLLDIKKAADGKTSTEMLLADRREGIKIAREYYAYLEASGELYGKAALLVINDEGPFGKTANIHLRTQAVFDGVKKEYLPELQDRIKISLACSDIEQRLKLKEKFNTTDISDYHKQVFKDQGVTEYAWGGLAIEELLGTGKWMKMVDANINAFDKLPDQLSKIKNKESNYAVDRLISSAKHSANCYIKGERDYAPMIRAGTPEQAAKWFAVDSNRVMKYADETSLSESPLVASYVYKILPNNTVKENSSQPITKKSVVFRPQETINEHISRHTGQKNLIDDLNKQHKENINSIFLPNFKEKWKGSTETSRDRAETVQAMQDASYVARNPFAMSFGITKPYYPGGIGPSGYPFYGQSPYDSMLYNLRWHDPLKIGGPYKNYNQYKDSSSSVSDFVVVKAAIRNLPTSSSVDTLYHRVKSDLSLYNTNKINLSSGEFKSILRHSKDFAAALVETKLISSYNSYHGTHSYQSILSSFLNGSIGGVATKVGIIEDLINSPHQVLDDNAILAIQNREAGTPFNEKELKEISAVLYNGIYKYNTYPFFSLHFNNDGALYPVIHPAYQNTIVGEVIGYLDYYMKGYLNGGIYPKEVLENWHKSPNTDKEYLKSLLIDLKKLSKEQGVPYQSLREMMYAVGLDSGEKSHNMANGDGGQKYMTSFRIISKLNSVETKGNILLIKPSFNVEYSIDLNPDYKEFLEQEFRKNNAYPKDYKLLNTVYSTAAKDILTKMPKFSFAKELFAKLDVINAISYYFSTLKEMGKVPIIEQPEIEYRPPFPKVLPPIPVRYYEKHEVNLTLGHILSKLKVLEKGDEAKNTLDGFLSSYYDNNELEFPEILQNRVKLSIKQALSDQLKDTIPAEEFLDKLTKELLQMFLLLVHHLDSEDMFKDQIQMLLDIEHVPEIKSEFNRETFNSLEKFNEKIDYLEKVVKGISDKAKTHIEKKATDEMSRSIISDITELPQEIRKEFNLESFNALGTLTEKINYYDRALRGIYDKTKSYAEQRIAGAISRSIISDITELPQEIRKEFNLESFNALGTLTEKINYYDRALRGIYDKTKIYFSNQLGSNYQKVDQEVNEALEKEFNAIIAKQGIPATSPLANVVKANLRTQNAAQITKVIAEAKVKCSTQYNSQLASLESFFSEKLNILAKIREDQQALPAYSHDTRGQFYKSQIKSIDNLIEIIRNELNKLKESKLHLTSITNEVMPILTSYQHPMLDIADGKYLKAVGTDLRVMGGVGLKLENFKSTDLLNSKATKIQEIAKQKDNYSFSSFTDEGKSYSFFKMNTKYNVVSSNFEYILNGKKNIPSRLENDEHGDLTVHMLAASGNDEELNNLLTKEPVLVDTKNARGYTPLMIAVQNDRFEATKILLSKGADVNNVLPNGLNSLTLAILNGHELLALHLINTTNVNINNENSNKQTALHYAIELKLTAIAKKLIEKGAILNVARKEDGYYPLHLAAKLGLDEVIEAIGSTKKFDMNTTIASGKSALHIAASSGKLVSVKLLLKQGVNINAQDTSGNTALMEALNSGHMNVAHHLSDFIKPNTTNQTKQTAALIAAKLNHFDIADKLIERGEDPLATDAEGHNYIYYLLTKGEFQRYVQLHKKLGFDINMSFNEGSSLLVAAHSGKHLLTNYLIEKGAKFTSNAEQQTLLKYAVRTDNVAYLLDYTSKSKSPSQKEVSSVDKMALLYQAAKNGSYRCFKELYNSFSQDDFLKVSSKEHVFASVIEGGNKEIITLLLKSGIIKDNNIILDNDNNTAGHLAVKYGFVSLLEFLSENGVNFRAQNKQGFTLYHLAIAQDDKEMLQKLMQLSGKENWPQDLYSFAITKDSKKCGLFLKEKNYKGQEYIANVNLSSLDEVCQSGDLAKAQQLLSTYNFKNLQGPLNKAITKGHLGVVELLLSSGATLKAVGGDDDPYACAIKNQQIGIIKFFNEHIFAGKLNNDKKPYYTGLTDNRYVKSAILEEYEQINTAASNLARALEKNNFTKINAILKSFPVNSVLIPGVEGYKPFLHYLFSKQHPLADKLIQKVLSYFHKNFDPMVKDADGNGLVHNIIKSHAGNPGTLPSIINLLNKYFAKHLPQLLQEKDMEGREVIEVAIKQKSSLPTILINENIIGVKDLSATKNIIQKLIASGDKELITLYIQKGIDINQKDENGLTPLMVAARSNLLDIVHLLVAKGAHVGAKDLSHNQALHIAIKYKNTEVALYLASLSQNLDYKDRDGNDALMLAAANNLLAMVDYLSREVSSKHIFNNTGFNALHLAAIQGHTSVVAKLLEIGFDINQGSKQVEGEKLHNSTPLQLSMLRGQQETAAFLIKNGASLSQKDSIGANTFEYGSLCKDEHMVYFMKTLNGFYNEDNQRKMMIAAVQSDNINMIRELYLNGVSLDIYNENGINLLQIASQTGAKKAINFILEQGIGVDIFNSYGKTALHYAVINGDSNVIQQLQEAGANVNLPDSSGKTPLFIAAEGGHYASVLQLLKSKANFTIREQSNITPAQIALVNGHVDIAKLLFIMGDTSFTNLKNGAIPAYVFKELQKHVALINKLQKVGQTVKTANKNLLFLAVELNSPDAVKVLITLHPEYLTQKDSMGKTPMDYATRETKSLLVNHDSNNATVSKNIIPLSPQVVTSSDLAIRLELISKELIQDIRDEKLIPSLVNLLSKLPVLSVMQCIKGLNEMQVGSREIYAKNCLNLLVSCNENKDWINQINEAFLRPYQWDVLIDTQLVQLIDSVKKINNNNLTKWFFTFFTPVEAHYITKEQLQAAIELFKVFINNFNPNLSDIPNINISFETGGIEYLERANWFMERSVNRDLQAKFLNNLPSADYMASINSHSSQINKLPLITQDMFVGDTLCSGKDINNIHDYQIFKANVFYSSTSSEADYSKALKFFDALEKSNFSNQEKVLVARVFFSKSSDELDIYSYLSSAFELKEQLNEVVFNKIYQPEESGKMLLTDYIVIAQLLTALKGKIDIKSLIGKNHNNLAQLKSELENHYNEHFADKNKESDADIRNMLKKFSGVEYPLSASELEIIGDKYKKLVAYSAIYKKMSLLQLTIEAAKESELLKTGKLETEPGLKLLAILREGIKHEFGIYPYNTQMLVVLSLLHDKDGSNKGKLAEVLTGEGKSTTITLLSSYLALTGQHVDIVTSSQDLAIRDHKKYAHFFELFNISSSHISYQDPEAKHFNANIIYGTNYDFEFAVLRTKVYDKKLFTKGDRVVIVDEVDNLFIDTALNSARIACPAQQDMSWIYEPVLNYVKINLGNFFIRSDSLKEYLKRYNPKEFGNIKEHLSDEYLKTLINSAQVSMQKQLNKDYVVRYDAEKGKQEVIIVDFDNTGKLNYGSRWSAGIHEFVEVMNGLKPQAENLTIASISHPSFFGLYSKIYGLTGTMGELEERQEVKTIYDIDSFDVPPHFTSKKQPLVTKFVRNPNDHYDQIVLSIKQNISEGRPVLVLFQSIEESEVFSKILTQNKLANNVLNEIQETHKEYILNKAGNPSVITIATNNAGRGTDIVLSKDSIKNGGLHVIVSFLPANLRVEEQVCGRAGRQGQPGSSEMIISINDPSIASLKPILIKLPEDQAISIILANRSNLVKKLSQHRVESSGTQKEIYKLLNKFTDSIDFIKSKLKELDISSFGKDYHHYKIVQGDAYFSKNSIMDNLYKQGASLIAHQSKGNRVEWGPFINEAKEKYITFLSQRWAEFFTKLDKHAAKVSSNSSDFNTEYDKFYETELKKAVEAPIKSFKHFVDEVVVVSSYYGSYMQPDLSNNIDTGQYGGEHDQTYNKTTSTKDDIPSKSGTRVLSSLENEIKANVLKELRTTEASNYSPAHAIAVKALEEERIKAQKLGKVLSSAEEDEILYVGWCKARDTEMMNNTIGKVLKGLIAKYTKDKLPSEGLNTKPLEDSVKIVEQVAQDTEVPLQGVGAE